jgi:hypothetical protein
MIGQREQTMAARQQWEHATACSRRLAITADTELRRRHPQQRIELLCSAEPATVSHPDREQLHAVPDQKTGEMAACARDLAAQRQGFRMKIEECQGQKIPDEDLDWGDLDEAFPARPAPRWDAILQPPKPQITPSARILLLAQERDTEPEAAD